MSGPNPEKAKLGAPPRWQKCPRKGLPISGRFVPLKTPLCDLYDSYVPEMNRFTPKMVFDAMQSQYQKIGLWIDLTNTDRFYAKEEVELQDARYTKFHCKGHSECPSEEQTNAFIQICRQFWTDHPKQLIAVHCTHGFNRTGFLICAYLVMEKDWSIEAAVQEFRNCRPPGIYKQDYLDELFRRFGDIEDVPTAPPLPDWCDESEPLLDDDEAESMPSTSNTNAKFMDGAVPDVRPVVSSPKREKLQKQCQDMCGWKKKGFPGGQPVSMEKENLVLLHQKPYKVSWKADGVRYMMLINGREDVYVFDRDHNVFQVPQLYFPHRKEARNIRDTLLDGEMIIDKVDGQDVFRYLIYDIIIFEGQPVGRCDFSRRLHCVAHEIIGPRNQAIMAGNLDKKMQTFSVRAKEFWPVEAVEKLLSEKFQANLPHEIDGLIFQPVPDPYVPGRCQSQLKWKPPHLNSVDFQLQVVKESKEGMLPEWKGYLFVLGMETPFAQLKLTKQLKQYDKKIIECSFDNGAWKFMRERTDKSFPNAYATAVGVCNSITFPIKKETLIEFIKNHAWKPSQKPAANHNQREKSVPTSAQSGLKRNGDHLELNGGPETKIAKNGSDAALDPPQEFRAPQPKR